MERKKTKWLFVILLSVCVFLAGCGDGIKEETKQKVMEKTDEALELYADLEKMVNENHLEVKQAFTDMKKQLTEMSARVKEQIEKTTEEDGKKAEEELDRMIKNLRSVKERVEQSLQ